MNTVNYRLNMQIVKKCVCVLGFFDGVHLGHRELIALGRKRADELRLPLLLFTFKDGSGIKSEGKRIYTEEKKLEIFNSLGVDIVALTDFGEISSLSYTDFINECLVKDFGASVAVCGFNFRFGKGALGTGEDLQKAFCSLGREVIVLDDYTLFGKTLSASFIKEMMANGDIKKVNTALGIPYSLKGEVVCGRGDGCRFGYPTANIYPDPCLILPAYGVYKSTVTVDGVSYSAITNIGTCPTFDDKTAHFESYIFDFAGDIYGKEIEVSLIDFIRKETKFDNKDLLFEQIKRDIEVAKET